MPAVSKWLMILLAATLPSFAALAQKGDAAELHGRWELVKMMFDGEEEETAPGTAAVEFYADGTMKSYVDGELDAEGRYSVDGDQLTVHLDGIEDAETATWAVDRGMLQLRSTQELAPGHEAELELVFRRIGDTDSE